MISYRQAEETDFELTFKIKTNALRPYIEQIWGWDADAQLDFHRRQFNPEHVKIILSNGREVGLVETEERTDNIFIASILVDPAFQRQGIGTNVIREIIKNAGGKNIGLQVFKINKRARKLYEQLGFTATGETELHYQMRYSPGKEKG